MVSHGQLDLHGEVEADCWNLIKGFLSVKDPLLDAYKAKGKATGASTASLEDASENEDEVDSVSQTDKSQNASDSNSMQDWVMAYSPSGDLVVFAKGRQIAFISNEWSSQNSRMMYSNVVFKYKFPEEAGIITSILCMPLISKKRTSSGQPDWTCVAVAFSDGHVRFFSETGGLLISQMFHDQSIRNIKCRSFQPAPTPLDHDQLEELLIFYRSVIVILDGFSLFQTLRACRNRLARLIAEKQRSVDDQTPIESPPLSCKKWKYEDMKTRVDGDSYGTHTPSNFDHLYNGSIIGGFHAKCTPKPHTSNIFVDIGTNPYVAFHHAKESHSGTDIKELAYAFASGISSSVVGTAAGFFGFGAKKGKDNTGEKKPPPMEPATLMSARFGLKDGTRIGQSVLISPCKRLSVVTDSLARVVLIDNELSIAVRMWKGYRDAQCAWIVVEDDVSKRRQSSSSSHGSSREALLLALYAPKRSVIDVFAMQQGPKIASFPVSRTGRLLSSVHGMMGLNNIPIPGGNRPLVQCLFLDDGQLYTFNIPYHLALQDNTNFKLKDMHLLKGLQKLLRDDKYCESDIMELLKDVKMQTMINQAFQILCMKCTKVDMFSSVLSTYLETFCDDETKDLSAVFKIQSLLEFYTTLADLSAKPPAYDDPKGSSSSAHDKTILACFHATKKEMKLLQDLANKEIFNKKQGKSVTFKSKDDSDVLTVTEYFSSLNLNFLLTRSAKNKEEIQNIFVNQKSNFISSFGKLLFCGCLNNQSEFKEWETRLKNSGLQPKEIFSLLFAFWCTNGLISSSYVSLMEKLYQLVRALCLVEGKENVISKGSNCSPWWDDMRLEISKSTQLFYAHSFALVCRAVSIDLLQESEADKSSQKKRLNDEEFEPESSDSSDDDFEEWENVSLDLVRWNILLKQIEDLSLLSTVLTQNIKLTSAVLPLIPHHEEVVFSVFALMEKGKGCIGELVGRWLTTIGVDPKYIAEMGTKNSDEKEETKYSIESLQSQPPGLNTVLQSLKCLQENFSVSLSISVIIANYGWEYGLACNKQYTNKSKFLEAAVQCVKYIPCLKTRLGMMHMMWNAFFLKRLSSIVSKGKPTEDEWGFSHLDTKHNFLKLCVEFLDHFMETHVLHDSKEDTEPQTNKNVKPSSSKQKDVHPRRKNIWSQSNKHINGNNNEGNTKSLVDLALLQPKTTYEMILLHYQLALVTYFSAVYNIRKTSMRPMHLFDTKSRMLLFSVMSSAAPYSNNTDVDLGLKNLREEFLCLVISYIVSHIPEEIESDDTPVSSDNLGIIPSEDGVKESEFWIQRCLELGRIWGIELDGLRINLTCEYYSCGFDYLGMEAIGSVNARDILGSKLLVIVGMRMNYLIQRSNEEDHSEAVSSLSTNLSNWLNSLNYSKLRCLRFSKQSIVELAQQVTQLIPDTSYDHRLAEEALISTGFL